MATTTSLVAPLRKTFAAGRTKSISWRLSQLDALSRLLTEHEQALAKAMNQDIGKPYMEAYAAETAFVQADIAYAKKHLRQWMRSEKVALPLNMMPGSACVLPVPLGVVLIIGPWNYPVQLVLSPLVGAIAAGNCAVIKPSELSPATSDLLADLLPRYLDPDGFRVVTGGVKETTELLKERFDHIFYTGSTRVGRIIMHAAADHLTPVTLELGGKCPAIVDVKANLEIAAKRIVWGKFFNAGQTCVAPDYVLVHAAAQDRLLRLMKQVVVDFFGSDPSKSRDYGRIVSKAHLLRLVDLMKNSGEIAIGGQFDEETRYLAPTILTHIEDDMPVMQEEIFGPLLPMVPVLDLDEAVEFLNERPHPLAMYIFSRDKARQTKLIEGTQSGAVSVNHVWLHLTVPGLPFGGVGESGMGAYHGKATFDTFTHRRSVLRKPTSVDPPLFYPPYTNGKTKWLKRLL